MRNVGASILFLVFTAGVLAGTALTPRGHAPGGPAGSPLRSQLRAAASHHVVLGLQRPKGTVSELDWQMFLRDEVTLRFPDGLTVWEAQGQWKGADGDVGHERSKVLLLVHPDTRIARAAVQSVISRYRRMFDQQSVLWETARVCAMS